MERLLEWGRRKNFLNEEELKELKEELEISRKSKITQITKQKKDEMKTAIA